MGEVEESKGTGRERKRKAEGYGGDEAKEGAAEGR